MKRISYLLLSVCMLILLVACSGSGNSIPQTPQESEVAPGDAFNSAVSSLSTAQDQLRIGISKETLIKEHESQISSRN